MSTIKALLLISLVALNVPEARARSKDCAAVKTRLKAAIQKSLDRPRFKGEMFGEGAIYTTKYCSFIRNKVSLNQNVADIVDRNPDCLDGGSIRSYRMVLADDIEDYGKNCR